MKAIARLIADPPLSRIPQIERLLQTPEAQELAQQHGRPAVASAIREALRNVRAQLLAGHGTLPDFGAPEFFAELRAQLERITRPSLSRVINATGVVLHTNLGRAPLAPEALAAIQDAAQGYCNLELDLVDGERASRHDHVSALLRFLTGAEDALVVNNCAAAVLLSLAALAEGGEVIVSRGELVEIGGSFRVPEVIAQSGARLVEVGTTNKTRIGDYQGHITAATRVLLRCHPSNYRLVGFTECAERRSLAELARSRGLVLVEDLGSGCLTDLSVFGLPPEPTVQECIAQGVDLATFSGDKLLGGPQAGVIVGRHDLIARLGRHPLSRAVRVDKLSLAALEATLRLYANDKARPAIPVLAMLGQDLSVLRNRARRLRRLIGGVPGLACEIAEDESLAGGGAAPGASLSTMIIRLTPLECSVEAYAGRLRAAQPAIVARVAGNRVILDMRTVCDREVAEIARVIRGLAAEKEGPSRKKPDWNGKR